MDKVLFKDIEQDCKVIIDRNINNFLKDKIFNVKDADFMINYLNEKILSELQEHFIPETTNFKFILSLVLLKNDSSGFAQDITLYYDNETDGCISEKYSFENIVCIFNLFCLSI